MIKVTNGKVDTKAILSLQSETEKNIMHKHSHHEDHEDHDHEEFETFIYNLGVQENKKNILDNIKALVENNEVLKNISLFKSKSILESFDVPRPKGTAKLL